MADKKEPTVKKVSAERKGKPKAVATELANITRSLAKDVGSKYINNTGFSTAVLGQLFDAAINNAGKLHLGDKTYGPDQQGEFIAQMEEWKQSYRDGGMGHGIKINEAIGEMLQYAYPAMSGAAGGKKQSEPLTKEEEKRFDAIMHKLGHLQEEINTDIDTDLTSIIKDSGLVLEQVWGLINNGVLDKKQVLVSIENAMRAAGTGLHIGALGDNLAIADGNMATRTEGVAEAQLAMGIAATLTGIIGAIRENKDMTPSQTADTALGAAVSAQNSALAFLLLMSGRVSAADAGPMHEAIIAITMVNVGLSIARKGFASNKDEMLEAVGKEVLKGLPHVAGRLTNTIGTLTGNAASVSSSVPVMAALTLISNEIIHQREMQKADVKNESVKDQHLDTKETIVAEAAEVKLLTEMAYRAFQGKPEVLTEVRESHEGYIEAREKDLHHSMVQVARVSAGYQGDVQKRTVARGIEVANLAISLAATAVPPAQLGMIVTGALSLTMSVAGNRMIEKTANNNFNIPSILDDAILVTDVKGVNRLIASMDIKKYHQPNIALVNEVIMPGDSLANVDKAVFIMLERSQHLTQFNLAFPEEVNQEHGKDFVGDLNSWVQKMQFMHALQARIGVGGVDESSTRLYPWINNLDQILGKLQDQGNVLLEKYENEVVKMTGGSGDLAEDIAYLKNQFNADNQLKLAGDFKQQTPESFYQNNKHKIGSRAVNDSVFGGALVASESSQEAAKELGVGDCQQQYAEFVIKMYEEVRTKIEACTLIQENLNPADDQVIKNHELLLRDFKAQIERLDKLASNGQLQLDPEYAGAVSNLQAAVNEKFGELDRQVKEHNVALHENLMNTLSAGSMLSSHDKFREPLKENQQAVIVERGKYNTFSILALRKNVNNAMEKIISNPDKQEIILEGLLKVSRENINDASSAKAINDRMVGLSRAVAFIVKLNQKLEEHNEKHGTSFGIANIEKMIESYRQQLQVLVDKYNAIMTSDKRDMTLYEAGKLDNFRNNLELFVRDVCTDVGNKTLFGQLAAQGIKSLDENIQSLSEIGDSSESAYRTSVHEEIGYLASRLMQCLKNTEAALGNQEVKAALGGKYDDVLAKIRNLAMQVAIDQGQLPKASDLSVIHANLQKCRAEFAKILTQDLGSSVPGVAVLVTKNQNAIENMHKELQALTDHVQTISKELIEQDKQRIAEQRASKFTSKPHQRPEIMERGKQRQIASNQTEFMQNMRKPNSEESSQAATVSERQRRLREAGGWSSKSVIKRQPANDAQLASVEKKVEQKKNTEQKKTREPDVETSFKPQG